MQTRLLNLFQDSSTSEKGLSSSFWDDTNLPSMENCQETLLGILSDEVSLSSNGSSRRDGGGNVIVETFSTRTGKLQRSLYQVDKSMKFSLVNDDYNEKFA
jgi:hypothetical protein